MTERRVLVVGSTGMLGEAVYQILISRGLHALEASRSRGFKFDAEVESIGALLTASGLRAGDFVVNCVGLTKSRIYEDQTNALERAVKLNVLFPMALARAAERLNLRVVQVATDCVFSGREGKYTESKPHDAYDLYGKSKSLGEIKSEQVMHLRCSLIGPEGNGRQSLFFEWVRSMAQGSHVNGYVNHNWNGLTSLAFAKIVAGIIENETFVPGLHHLVPADEVTKDDLIRLELELLKREDVTVEAFRADESIDRTLATQDSEANRSFFAGGGYEHVPSIREMMEELPWEALRER